MNLAAGCTLLFHQLWVPSPGLLVVNPLVEKPCPWDPSLGEARPSLPVWSSHFMHASKEVCAKRVFLAIKALRVGGFLEYFTKDVVMLSTVCAG